MKIVFYALSLLLFSLFSLNTSGQSKIEQLESQLAAASENDKAKIHNQLAQLYMSTDIVKSRDNADNALKNALSSKNASEEATAHINLGMLNYKARKYQDAIGNYTSSLSIHEANNSAAGVGYNNIQIGLCYTMLKKSTSAIQTFNKAFKSYQGIKDYKGMSHALVKIGEVHFQNGNYQKAITEYEKAIIYDKKTNDARSMASSYYMIGTSYSNFGNYKEAKTILKKALSLAKSNNLSRLANDINKNLAVVEDNLKNYHESKSDFEKTEEAKVEEQILSLEEKSSQLEEKTSDFLNTIASLDEENKIIALMAKVNEDAMNQAKLLKDQKEQELILEKQKSELKDAELEKKNAKMKQQELVVAQQKTQLFALIGGIVFLLAIAFLILNRYQQKKKANTQLAQQNKEITEQKEEISGQKTTLEAQKTQLERSNKQMTDSIDYAKRIQSALLSSSAKIEALLPESFVLFKPKAVVSGDFYWIKEKDGKVLFAAADCTGHGVPGAFMSIISNNVLNDIMTQHNTTNPGEILKLASDEIIDRLQDKEAQVVESADGTKTEWEVKDGMDIALCSLNRNSLQMQYAGAHNPLYVIRNGELIEYRGDRLFIGNTTDATVFKTHDIQLQKGDMLYVFSDGFPDQKGGPDNKKFYYQPFQDMLLQVHRNSMDEQREYMDKVITHWIGDNDQIDDILIFGIRV